MSARWGSRGTGQAGPPTWWASFAVRSASLPLPSEDRYRYRQEFLAELYGMTRPSSAATPPGSCPGSGPYGLP
jgi:hypothetical protein